MSRVVPYGTRKFLIAIVTCRQVAWLLTIAVIIGEGGCIAAKQPSERAQLGTVGVVLRQLGPKRLDLPAKGGGEGTARGATAGARMALYGTGPLGLILWPFGAALGAVAGAAGAEDEAKVKAAQETLLAALNGFRPGEAIRDRLVDVSVDNAGDAAHRVPNTSEGTRCLKDLRRGSQRKSDTDRRRPEAPGLVRKRKCPRHKPCQS